MVELEWMDVKSLLKLEEEYYWPEVHCEIEKGYDWILELLIDYFEWDWIDLQLKITFQVFMPSIHLLLTVLILLNRSLLLLLLLLVTFVDGMEESRFTFGLVVDDSCGFCLSFDAVDFRSDVAGGINDCERFPSTFVASGFLGIFFRLLIEAAEVLAVVDGAGNSCLIELFDGDLTEEVNVDSGLIEVLPGILLMALFKTT